MKLPDNKKERMQVLVLVAIFGVGALYGLFVGVIKPLKARRAVQGDEVAELRENIRIANIEIAQMKTDRRANDLVKADLRDITQASGYILEARLGNYLLSATEIIEAAARDAGVIIESPREIGISQLPEKTKTKTSGTFAIYTARIGFVGTFHDLIRLLYSIEKSNPYLCVASISATASPKARDMHVIMFDVQWPVWADEETMEMFLNKLAATPSASAESNGSTGEAAK